METPDVQRIDITKWFYAFLILIVGLVVFQFWRIGRLKARNKKLMREYESQKRTLDAVSALQDIQTMLKQEPEKTEEAEALESVELQASEAPIVVASEPGDFIPAIPASLRYKIQPLDGRFRFNALSTNESGNYVYCVLLNDLLLFRLNNAEDEEILSETKPWPVLEKEIGTILNRMLQTPKPS